MEFALSPQLDPPILTVRHHIIQFLMLVLGPTLVVFATIRFKAIQSRWLAILIIGPIAYAVALFIGVTIGMTQDWLGDSL